MADLKVLPLSDSIDALAPHVVFRPAKPILHQFWDKEPPREITALLRYNAKLCSKWKIEHKVWTEKTGDAFLAAHFPKQLALFRRSPHPAMASDLLRLCILLKEGGLYLDADMALRPEGQVLPSLLHEALFFKWNLEKRSNVPNWLFGFRAGHPMLQYVLDVTTQQMRAALDADAAKALREILQVSGPAIFTRALGSYFAQHGCPPGCLILNVEDAYKMVQNGPEYLRKPLIYKTTALHWKVAGQEQ